MLFESGHLRERRSSLTKKCLAIDNDDPGIWWDYGLVIEKLGDEAAALRAFERAHELDPEDFPLPVPISAKEGGAHRCPNVGGAAG